MFIVLWYCLPVAGFFLYVNLSLDFHTILFQLLCLLFVYYSNIALNWHQSEESISVYPEFEAMFQSIALSPQNSEISIIRINYKSSTKLSYWKYENFYLIVISRMGMLSSCLFLLINKLRKKYDNESIRGIAVKPMVTIAINNGCSLCSIGE